jgi:predicted restriction endonuclease
LAGWTRDQLLVALGLYCTMEFGKFHQHNPRIIEVAEKIGRTPSALAMKLSNLASLDPVIRESGRRGLEGASSADRAIWRELEESPDQIMPAAEDALANLSLSEPLFDIEPEPASAPEPISYAGEDRLAITRQRRGQHIFRKSVLSSYEHRCCITGLADTRFLVASHIRPWRSDRHNRLNPHNGLCLSTLYDRAFDLGLITFSEDFRLMVSISLREQADSDYVVESFLRREGQQIRLPSKFGPDAEIMAWHRQKCFVLC